MANTLRIVVADDDRNLKELVASWLTQAGHLVVAVADGRALVDVCRASPIDVVVSEVRMLRLDGLTAATLLRREADVPAVLMSGSWTAPEEDQARGVGAEILTKPFRPLALLAAIRRAAGGNSSPRRRVLLALDDGDDGLAERLAGAGYEVCACRAVEGAAAAEIVRPHLILVGAGGSGRWEVVRQVRKHAWGQEIRILAVSGWDGDCRREEAVAAGCDGQLLRPIGNDEVACLIDDSVCHSTY